jgi:hypothetical protein
MWLCLGECLTNYEDGFLLSFLTHALALNGKLLVHSFLVWLTSEGMDAINAVECETQCLTAQLYD